MPQQRKTPTPQKNKKRLAQARDSIKLKDFTTYALLSHLCGYRQPKLCNVAGGSIITELRKRGIPFPTQPHRKFKPLTPLETKALEHVADGWPIRAVSAKFKMQPEHLKFIVRHNDPKAVRQTLKAKATNDIRPEI